MLPEKADLVMRSGGARLPAPRARGRAIAYAPVASFVQLLHQPAASTRPCVKSWQLPRCALFAVKNWQFEQR